MSADADYRWIKTDEIGNHDWSEGGIAYMDLPEVPCEYDEDTPGFENIEALVVGLLKETRSTVLLDNGCDYVFDCNVKTLDGMIEKCRSLIHELVDTDNHEREMEIAHIFYNECYEWNGELAEDLCRTLRMLKFTKESILKHEGWSLIVELAW